MTNGHGLSPRQLECLKLAAEGLGNKEIGRRIGLGANTVRGHLHYAFIKLGVHTRMEAIIAVFGPVAT